MVNHSWRCRLRSIGSQFASAFPFAILACFAVPAGSAQVVDGAANTTTAPTAVPRLIKYTGTLVDARGYPITTPVNVTFALYNQQSENNKPGLWCETQQVSPNEKGAYTVYLGAASAKGLPSDVFTAVTAQWLGIKVEGETELPRVLLTSVPYALKAGDAQTLGGLPASAYALAGSTMTSSGINFESSATATPNATSTVPTTGGTSGYLPQFTGASTVGNSQVFASSAGVAINKTSPAAVLDVNGDMIVRGPTIVARTGNATATQGFPSFGFNFYSNAYNSSTKVADNPHFILQSEPLGNNTASTSATFNVLYSNLGKTVESGFYINPNGTLHFSPSQSFPGSVTSVGLTAPSIDFGVSGSPVTGNGSLNFYWKIQPTSSNVANGIVKRDSGGGFSASLVSTGSLAANSITVYGPAFMAAANLAGPIGIGTNSPRALMNLNQNDTASTDALLLGNNTTKGLQLRDNGTGVDLESIGVPLNLNFVTQQPIYLNPYAGTVFVHDPTATGAGDGTTLPALSVGGNPNSSIFFNEPYSAHFAGDVLADDGIATPDVRRLIDHPLDPTNKYLLHSAINSSEALNQYSGNITTDELGLATVHLPDWFEAENIDFRYQLTVISGQFAQAVVSKKVAHNQFTIGTNAPHVEVSWLLTAKRNDPYAKAHPMVVEQEKPAFRRGHYEHPELYGHPEPGPTGTLTKATAQR